MQHSDPHPPYPRRPDRMERSIGASTYFKVELLYQSREAGTRGGLTLRAAEHMQYSGSYRSEPQPASRAGATFVCQKAC